MRPAVRHCLKLACFLFGAPLLAQRGTGELRIAVHDATGAPIPATAGLINEAAALRQSATLPATGAFIFKNLPLGLYRLSVTQSGFQPYTQLLEIRSEAPLTRDITLGIQPIETALNISASDTLLDPNRTGSTYYVGAQELRERSTGIPGRDLINLVVTQPGWTLEANGVLHPRESEYETQYIVNGFPVQDNRSPSFAPSMEADEVENMKIYTSGIPAEFGRKVGGVIEVNTGRNTSPGFHGDAVLQGGGFATAGGFLSGQYVAGATTASVTAEGFLTDRYLDPPVLVNYTNHASSGSFAATLERDLSPADRLRFSASHREVKFEVPDELIQHNAGQREDRGSAESQGQVSWQHVFSPAIVGAVRGMVRDVAVTLWSNPLATPISVAQNRSFRDGYGNASLSGHHGRHEWKTGAEASFASLDEQFGFDITAYRVNGVRIFDRDTPATFAFRGHGYDAEQSAYAQDAFRAGGFTLSAGLRFDHYRLLIDETAWSPRLGATWYSQRLGLALHASYDRTFGTPPFENILVSAAPATAALNNAGFYLPLHPSRGNYYEGGFTKTFAKQLRFDASYFRRDIRNYQDDDLLVNTGVSFPVAFRSAEIRGTEAKLTVPRWGRFSGFLSYANTIGVARFPIAGGLFLDDGAAALLSSTDHFPVSQDQRNTARAMLRAELTKRLWTSWSATYNSGLPVERVDTAQTRAFLISQYGAPVVNSVNFDRGRAHPTFSLDAAIGATLWQHEKRTVTAQFNALNLTDRLNVIDFAGLLSGTAIAPPRSYGVRVRAEF